MFATAATRIGGRGLSAVASEGLEKIGDATAILPLVAALESEQWCSRAAAVHALEALGWQPINDAQRALRSVALRKWNEAVSVGDAAIEPLMRACHDSSPFLPENIEFEIKASGVSFTLGSLDVSNKCKNDATTALQRVSREKNIRHLIDSLGDRMSTLVTGSSEAENELIKAGEDAIPLLLENIRISSRIPWILAKIGSPKVVLPLCELLFETGGFERDFAGQVSNRRAVCAAEALGEIGNPRALLALEKIARETREGGTLNAVTDAIARIRGVGVYSPHPEESDIAAIPESEQAALAKNPNTPGNTLEKLASSKNMGVIIAVAENPSASHETLRNLNNRFSVPGKRLYWQFANNPNCPKDLLKEIVEKCENPYTVDLARNHPNFKH